MISVAGPIAHRYNDRLALLLFHKNWDICRSRIDLLRALNPSVPIHGLYGGSAADAAPMREHLGASFESLYEFRLHDGPWRRKHTDLVVRQWYLDHGFRIQFRVLHVLQWDLLLFRPLDELYRHIPPDALALTGLTYFRMVADRWLWAIVEPLRSGTIQLLEHGASLYGYTDPMVCQGPGYALPRSFLDRYASTDVPDFGHDELRLPMYGQVFGMPLADTGFYPKWLDSEEERLFNANNVQIPVEEVRQELTKPGGRRAFHACRESYDQGVLQALIAAADASSQREARQ
jgi:hypothetical protein